MKVLIGITQGLEGTRNFISREFKGTGTLTETGPFRSFEDVSKWENYMKNRAGGSELLSLPGQQADDDFWHGVTLEWDDD